MKKNLLFIFLLMIFIIPLEVKGETFYFNYGEYQYSIDVIDERSDLEVQTIIEDGNTIYKYRTRDYLTFPSKITITSKDFDILALFDTNIPLEDIKLKPKYDLDTMNNCYGNLIIEYKDTSISKSVYIQIDNYIDIPEEIIVNDYEFDIWNYIDTNIVKEEIIFTGEYDLNTNGEYEILTTWNDIEKKTKIIVDIDENKKEIIEEVTKEDNEKEIVEDKKEEIVENIVESVNEKVLNTCINNYYEIIEPNKEIEYVEKQVPVSNKVNCKDTDYNKGFRYISYAFYGVTTILLSIIVVRKK